MKMNKKRNDLTFTSFKELDDSDRCFPFFFIWHDYLNSNALLMVYKIGKWQTRTGDHYGYDLKNLLLGLLPMLAYK